MKNKLVYGVGINDADYKVNISTTVGYTLEGKQIQKVIWRCPYYKVWSDMLRRCCSEDFKKQNIVYADVEVCEEWLRFSSFRNWSVSRYADGMQLDKDILIRGNRLYSPQTCCYVPNYVNTIILTCSRRSNMLIGATYKKSRARYSTPYVATSTINGHIGCFSTAEEAHRAWQVDRIQSIESVIERYRKDTYFLRDVENALILRVDMLKRDIKLGLTTEYL